MSDEKPVDALEKLMAIKAIYTKMLLEGDILEEEYSALIEPVVKILEDNGIK